MGRPSVPSKGNEKGRPSVPSYITLSQINIH